MPFSLAVAPELEATTEQPLAPLLILSAGTYTKRFWKGGQKLPTIDWGMLDIRTMPVSPGMVVANKSKVCCDNLNFAAGEDATENRMSRYVHLKPFNGLVS